MIEKRVIKKAYHLVFGSLYFLDSPIKTIWNYFVNGKADVSVNKKGSEFKTHVTRETLGLENLIISLIYGWKIKNEGKNLRMFHQKLNMTLIQPNAGAIGDDLLFKQLEHIDFGGKTVLDVGAYFGETALLFLNKGAKKVIAIEPLKENVKIIEQNAEENGVNKKIETKLWAVGNENGVAEIVSKIPPGFCGFGLPPKSGDKKYVVSVETISWEGLLKFALKKKVDIVKVDCEGYEKFLVNVHCDLLRKFPVWTLELHSKEIEKSVLAHFRECGFNTIIKMSNVYVVKKTRS